MAYDKYTYDVATSAQRVEIVSSPSASPANTTVVSSASSVTILAANAARKGATITNDSTAILYLSLAGGTASTSNYSVQLSSGAYYEVPFTINTALTGIWASANGNARVTELT